MLSSPVKALIPSKWLHRLRWIKKWPHPEKEAVILFTSGTEAMPKGVPLTHKNLLSNMQAALCSVDIRRNDTLLSALPPFHSFGFSVTGLLPLLAGVRVVFAPNPTDAGQQLRILHKWEATILCSAPSFLLNVMKQGSIDLLQSLRLIVSGAEKAPKELIEQINSKTPQAKFLEGYGITECAPILTINNTGDPQEGVGSPLENTKIKIVHPEDFSITLPCGQAGMILAQGPNIFEGYLQTNVSSPFYHDDVRWYVTGDIGYLNEKGSLTITGRLKRFVKIGGEMFSLGAIESALTEEPSIGQGEGPQLAICAKGEAEGRPHIIAFTTKELPLLSINTILRKKGFSNLVRIDRVISLEEIPLTGTGKIAYRELEMKYS